MCSVTFLGPLQRGGPVECLEVRLAPGQRCILLHLIRQYGLLRKCGCRKGKCGGCAVKVAVLHPPGQSPEVCLSEEEKKRLLASGKLTKQQAEATVFAYTAPLWRLACQYIIGDQDIVVAFS